jgi:hypothetical protein
MFADQETPMSRNEKRIRDVCKELGVTVISLIWEPVTSGFEMCGPNGGWLLNNFDSIGYSTDEAIAWLRESASYRK